MDSDSLKQMESCRRLAEVVKSPAWKDIMAIVADISQKHYPDPRKYTYFPWKNLMKDYTFARGVAEGMKELIIRMEQQPALLDKYLENEDAGKDFGL